MPDDMMPYPISTMMDPFIEGRNACPAVPRWENPYPVLTPKHVEWDAGWAGDSFVLYANGRRAAIVYCARVGIQLDMADSNQAAHREVPHDEGTTGYDEWMRGWTKEVEETLRETGFYEEEQNETCPCCGAKL